MINRVLIRLKIVQIVYAYYQNGGKNLDTAEKELFFSLSKAYDLYNYLLLLMVEVTKQANKRLNAAKNKLVPTKEELFPNTKFVENRFIAQLEVNKQLLEFSNNQKKTWENEADFVKTLCDKILESGSGLALRRAGRHSGVGGGLPRLSAPHRAERRVRNDHFGRRPHR